MTCANVYAFFVRRNTMQCSPSHNVHNWGKNFVLNQPYGMGFLKNHNQQKDKKVHDNLAHKIIAYRGI